MKRALNAWGAYIAGQKKFKTGSLMPVEQLAALYEDEIMKIAGAMLEATQKDRAKNPPFYSVVSFKIQQSYWKKAADEQKDSIDFKFWLERGWLNKETDYYSPHKANPIKIKTAGLFAKIIEKLMFS